MGGFSDLVDDMDEMIEDSLSDTCADYQPPFQGAASCKGLPVQVERNLQMLGAEGSFQTTLVGVSWRKCRLATVDRGGSFLLAKGNERLMVENIIEDDGDWVTAACMVQK